MEYFGLTKFGSQDPIKNMMNYNYVEPMVPRDIIEIYELGDKKKPFASCLSNVDVYIGQADGYAYKSYNRLIRMRIKGTLKPVGPHNMYRYPGCTSMDYGWFLTDPALKDQSWCKAFNKYK